LVLTKISFRIFGFVKNCHKTILIFIKKLKKGLKYIKNPSDILIETVTYMDVSRQGRNYKEVDKKKILHQGGLSLWQ